jgi:phage terminase large subunit-like protein
LRGGVSPNAPCCCRRCIQAIVVTAKHPFENKFVIYGGGARAREPHEVKQKHIALEKTKATDAFTATMNRLFGR